MMCVQLFAFEYGRAYGFCGSSMSSWSRKHAGPVRRGERAWLGLGEPAAAMKEASSAAPPICSVRRREASAP